MKMYRAHKALTTDHGTEIQCLEVIVPRPDKKPLVARFGGLRLRTNPFLKMIDVPEGADRWACRTELVQRLLADTCELCGSRENVEVHHIRKLADLKVPGRREKP